MLLPIFCVGLLSLNFAVAQSINAHVFLIVGQSNAVGLNTDGYTDEDTTDPRIQQLSCCKDGAELPYDQCVLAVAQDPLHHQCDGYYLGLKTLGFSMSFARQHLKDLPSNEGIVLVPAALSATGFFDNTWNAYTGHGFISAVAKLKQTFALLKQSGINPTLDGILWHQGEHDAGDNFWGQLASTEQYLYNDTIPMINAFRDLDLLPFTSTNLPFACANLLPSWVANATHPSRIWVDNALSVLEQHVPYSACAPSLGLEGDPGTQSGLTSENIHFTGASQRILGRRIYAAWQLAKTNMPVKP